MGEEIKRTGRPPVSGDKRSKFVNVRFTEPELSLLDRFVTETGMSRTDLIRLRTLEKVEVILINSRELLSALDEIGEELGHIGRNINQLAHHANTLRLQERLDQNLIKEFNSLFGQYLARQRSLESLLRKVIRVVAR